MVMLCEQHSASRLDDETVDPSMWRQVKLVLTRSDASRVDVELLRSLDWFHEHGVQLGETVFLNMPEMGACGPAEVLAIDACPALEQGPGRLITGTFRHTAAVVYDLKIDAESEPIGVTGSHPFWSVDRGNWVAVTDLQIGERLRTLEGLAKVESLTKRPKPEPVYNIEVEGDHCYRVGDTGVLVHNQSAPALTGNCTSISSFSNDHSTRSMFPSPVGHGIPPYSGGATQGVLVFERQEARLVSGVGIPGQWIAQGGAAGGLGSGRTAGVTSHVEGHAASIMLQCCISEATLYINRKPCKVPPAMCQIAVGRLLPKGSTMHVVYESEDGTKAMTGRFVGGGIGWIERHVPI